ncbi:hypothetical protein N9Y81_01550 [Akkermansiaceae bacterium]|jgi:hypothetical protein|nr:hypothetical protein [Akkermansiaceae bacterium]
MNSKPLLFFALCGILLQSCVQSVMKDHNFKKTQAVEINGAQVKSALKPLGGKGGISLSAMVYAAGTGSLDGPFRWRVEAEGVEGEHGWIRVNQARVTTEKTKRSEPYPRKYLGSQSKFVPIPGEKGKAFAKFEIPGKLTVFPRKDGKTKIHLNVSVRAKGRTESKWLLFELEPESKWKTESIFLPVEIVKSFRGNPREWDW